MKASLFAGPPAWRPPSGGARRASSAWYLRFPPMAVPSAVPRPLCRWPGSGAGPGGRATPRVKTRNQLRPLAPAGHERAHLPQAKIPAAVPRRSDEYFHPLTRTAPPPMVSSAALIWGVGGVTGIHPARQTSGRNEFVQGGLRCPSIATPVSGEDFDESYNFRF
jgi:hypothetical protein